MKEQGRKSLRRGFLLLLLFALWTALVCGVDVQTVEQTGTEVGFATVNFRFHELTGVHMGLYTITDWLGLVPVSVCIGFGIMGAAQLITRRSLIKVDRDIILLGVYYIIVMAGYIIFEMIPVNYRPVLIEGRLEASYPSSTTLLVLGVMPTLAFQAERRMKCDKCRKLVMMFSYGFSVLMVAGRLVSGVHWLTDIVGSVLLSTGLFCIYRSAVILYSKDGK